MRWRLGTLVGACAALWVDALAGGRLVSGTPAVVVVAALSLAAGLRGALLRLGAAGAASAGLLSVADQVAEHGRFGPASDGVFYCVVVLVPSLIGWLIAGNRRQVAALLCSRRLLEGRQAVAAGIARAEERERVVRHLDLGLADRLVQVVADVRDAQKLVTAAGEDVPARLGKVEASARAALAELRDALDTVRSPGAVDAAQATAPGSSPPTATAVRIDLVDVALVAGSLPLAIETASPGHAGPAVLNVLAALAQGVALGLLRRRPVTGLVGLLAVAAVQTSMLSPLPPTVSWLLPTLSAALLLGLNRSRSIAVVGLGVLVAGDLLITLVTPAHHRSTSGLVPGLVMGVLVWAGARLAAAARARARELQAITDELRCREDDEVRLAVLQQRAEIARDLHDAGAHALTVVCLQAAAARAWWHRDPARALRAFDALADVAEHTVRHVGQSFGGYARGGSGDAFEPGAFEDLIGIGRALGLDVDLGVTGAPRVVPDDIVHAAYRVVQEGLTNAARHAAGSRVRIGIAYGRDDLHVHVLDFGASSTAVVTLAGAGAGLRGMRERVETLNGELRAGPRGRGFEISARLPT